MDHGHGRSFFLFVSEYLRPSPPRSRLHAARLYALEDGEIEPTGEQLSEDSEPPSRLTSPVVPRRCVSRHYRIRFLRDF